MTASIAAAFFAASISAILSLVRGMLWKNVLRLGAGAGWGRRKQRSLLLEEGTVDRKGEALRNQSTKQKTEELKMMRKTCLVSCRRTHMRDTKKGRSFSKTYIGKRSNLITYAAIDDLAGRCRRCRNWALTDAFLNAKGVRRSFPEIVDCADSLNIRGAKTSGLRTRGCGGPTPLQALHPQGQPARPSPLSLCSIVAPEKTI